MLDFFDAQDKLNLHTEITKIVESDSDKMFELEEDEKGKPQDSQINQLEQDSQTNQLEHEIAELKKQIAELIKGGGGDDC